VGLAVSVGVAVSVRVTSCVGVTVAVTTTDFVGSGVCVFGGVGVSDGVGVGVFVGVFVAVSVGVDVSAGASDEGSAVGSAGTEMDGTDTEIDGSDTDPLGVGSVMPPSPQPVSRATVASAATGAASNLVRVLRVCVVIVARLSCRGGHQGLPAVSGRAGRTASPAPDDAARLAQAGAGPSGPAP
jgi:hypothetical protein